MSHLRQSVPQNGRVHLLGIDFNLLNKEVVISLSYLSGLAVECMMCTLFRKIAFGLALFRSLCDKRQLSRKNKFDKLSGNISRTCFCRILSPKLRIMQGFGAQTHLFAEVTGPQPFQRTKKKCPVDLRKFLVKNSRPPLFPESLA